MESAIQRPKQVDGEEGRLHPVGRGCPTLELLPMKISLKALLALGMVSATADLAIAQGNWGMRRPPRENRRINLNLRDAQDGYPIGSRPPWHYGYNMHDYAAGYFGGGNYTNYYAYGRGGVSIGNFPDSLPGPVWTRDPKRTPWLDQLPIFTNPLTDPTDKEKKEEKALPDEDRPAGEVGNPIVQPDRLPDDLPAVAAGEAEKPGVAVSPFPPFPTKPIEKKTSPDLAHMVVLVPEAAELWLEGTKMTQKGSRREFVTPKLDPGMLYQYRIKARWTDSGKPVEREKILVVQGGDERTIDLRDEKTPPKESPRGLSEPNILPKLEVGGSGS